ncbi:MAG: PQQ-dependent sugar dehydrogenase [Gammaproteobacteria bacterium]|nr:PQQ-dependent sugar dehydrogenase [Gammaproteobacteria bacterium]
MKKIFTDKHPTLIAIIWPIMAAGTALLVLRYLHNGHLSVSDDILFPAFLLLGCYLAASVVVFLAKITRLKGLLFGPAVFAGMASIVLLAIIVFSFQYSRLDITVVFCLLGLLSLIYYMLPSFRGISLIFLFVASIAVVLYPQVRSTPPSSTLKSSDFVLNEYKSHLYDLDIRKYQNLVPRSTTHSAMAAIGRHKDVYLLVMSNGDIYSVRNLGSDKAIETVRWNIRVPVNHKKFYADAGTSAFLQYFRTLDVLILNSDTSSQMLVSHHYWNESEQCATMRVSFLKFSDIREIESGNAVWEDLFETTPCLLLQPEAWAFRGMEGGGRLALLNSENVLLTVGDHGVNGHDYDENFVDDPGASYGKTLRIGLNSGEAEVFTTGHRNQQGLYVDHKGSIWSTEHGPRGGDELNLLEAGHLYGWPRITYGTDYGSLTWPLEAPKDQSKYTLPVFSWVPAIGVSNLAGIGGETPFPFWRDDLIISSLLSQSLYRTRIEQESIRYLEPIPIGERIRDLLIDENGIILWTDSRSLIQILPATQ